MIKFAFSKPFVQIFYILIFIILTSESFAGTASEHFQKPFLKCWELKNASIDSFASDNEYLIISQNDGNILRLDKLNSEQIWKTSFGDKDSSKIKLIQRKIFLITTEKENDPGDSISDSNSNSNSKNILTIRNIDGLTGVVKNFKEFQDVIKGVSDDDFGKSKAFYLNSKSEIGELDVIGESLDWFSGNYQVGKNTILTDNERYLVFSNNSDITQIKRSFESERRTIKSQSSEINAVALTNDSIFWGDDSGKVFQKKFDKADFEKVLRTGGKISFLQNVDDNILVTSNDNYIYLFSNRNRKLLWKKRLSGRVTVKPQILENTAVVTTSAESDMYFVNLENGKIFNQISLPKEVFIKHIHLDETSLYAQTNNGLIRFSEDCNK